VQRITAVVLQSDGSFFFFGELRQWNGGGGLFIFIVILLNP
jgi:hypothetical protein